MMQRQQPHERPKVEVLAQLRAEATAVLESIPTSGDAIVRRERLRKHPARARATRSPIAPGVSTGRPPKPDRIPGSPSSGTATRGAARLSRL